MLKTLLLFALMLQTAEASENAKSEHLTKLLEAWDDRQSALRLLDVSWSGVWLTPKNSRQAIDGSSTVAYPPEDCTVSVSYQYVRDSNRECFIRTGSAWSTDLKKWVPENVKMVNQPSGGAVYFSQGNLKKPFLSLQKPETIGRLIASQAELSALRLLFAPLSSSTMGGIKRDSIKVVEEGSLIKGRDCIGVTFVSTPYAIAPEFTEKLWVYPDAEYIPFKYEVINHDAIVETIDFSYELTDAGKWAITSWKANSFFAKDGDLRASYDINVTNCSFPESIPASIFSLDIKEGVWVSDEFTGENYAQKPSGEKRLIIPGEYNGSNFDEILDTESGELLFRTSPPLSSTAWAIIVLTVVVLTLVTYRYFQRK